jgi:uncharacterized protein YbjQ (UPF0145 family)
MQISHTKDLEDGRQTVVIGRIKAAAPWRGANTARSEAERAAALNALILQAEDFGADAIVGVDYELDGVTRADIDGVALRRIAATGIAVRFAIAA